jgi:MFS transporter, DHA2 family, multidrug resistance protein
MEAHDGLPLPRRYWAILTVALAITMAVLDGAIANIALPTIARDLRASPATSIWVVNAYQLVITVSLLPMASLGDVAEYRRVYRVGLIVFMLASLGCSVSGSLISLTLARMIQGFGAAGIMSVNAALVRFIYPSRILGRGLGINAVIVAVSAAIGPTVAAAILSVASWQWLFAINVPIGAVALLAAQALPRTPRAKRRFDGTSAILNALTFGLLIIAIDGIGHGEGVPLVGGEFLGAVLSGFVLIRRELSRASPVLPVDLFRIPIFTLSVATSIGSFIAQMLAYVTLPFYLQYGFGRTAVETGLLMTPWPLASAVVAPVAGRLADRYSAGMLGGLGLAVFAAGLVLLALLPEQAGTFGIVWRMALCGLGFGLFQSPNNREMINAAPRERSGGASGMLGMARLLGQTTGAALVALIFGRFAHHADTVALLSGGCIAAAAALVSCLRLIRPDASPVSGDRGSDRSPSEF